jgi:hypothetical protein
MNDLIWKFSELVGILAQTLEEPVYKPLFQGRLQVWHQLPLNDPGHTPVPDTLQHCLHQRSQHRGRFRHVACLLRPKLPTVRPIVRRPQDRARLGFVPDSTIRRK